MKFNSFLKLFDKELFEILALNSLGIGFLLIQIYGFSVEKALLVAPLLSLSIFLGLIFAAHVFSLTMEIVEKGVSIFR